MFDSGPKDAQSYLQTEGVLDLLDDRGRRSAELDPIPPDLVDLARLHRLIRARMSFTVLEFGIGYSTVMICDALATSCSGLDWTTRRVCATDSCGMPLLLTRLRLGSRPPPTEYQILFDTG